MPSSMIASLSEFVPVVSVSTTTPLDTARPSFSENDLRGVIRRMTLKSECASSSRAASVMVKSGCVFVIVKMEVNVCKNKH